MVPVIYRVLAQASWLAVVLCAPAAHALDAPVGWTALDPHRAVLCPTDPGRGDLRELVLPGGTGRPHEILEILAAQGIAATPLDPASDGTFRIQVGAEAVGFARPRVAGGTATWFLLLVRPDEAPFLDAGALLTSLERPGLPRGLPPGAVEVLPAGADGNLWQAGREPAASAPFDPWGAAAAEEPWPVSAPLVGVWGAWAELPSGRTEIVLQLDAGGRASLERRCGAARRVEEGTWGVRRGELRMEPFTGNPWQSSFEADASTLAVHLEGRRVVLVRRR